MRAKTLGNDELHAEIHRRQRRMFTRRTLPIILAADDREGAGFFGALGEILVDLEENEFRDRRDVRPQRENFGAGRHDMIGGDIVAEFEQRLAADLVGDRRTQSAVV